MTSDLAPLNMIFRFSAYRQTSRVFAPSRTSFVAFRGGALIISVVLLLQYHFFRYYGNNNNNNNNVVCRATCRLLRARNTFGQFLSNIFV